MPFWDKRRERIAGFVLGDLEPGEEIRVVVPTTQTAHAPGLRFLTWPLAAYYGLVLTDRRLVVVRCNPWSTPRAVVRALPRTSVQVERYEPGPVWGKLSLRLERDVFHLNVHHVVRADTDLLARGLGAAVATPSYAPRRHVRGGSALRGSGL